MPSRKPSPFQQVVQAGINLYAPGMSAVQFSNAILEVYPGLGFTELDAAYAAAQQAYETATEIIPGSELTPSDIPGTSEDVTVELQVSDTIIGGEPFEKTIEIVLPRDSTTPIWDLVMHDFWVWYREEYKAGNIPTGGSVPTFEILGVY